MAKQIIPPKPLAGRPLPSKFTGQSNKAPPKPLANALKPVVAPKPLLVKPKPLAIRDRSEPSAELQKLMDASPGGEGLSSLQEDNLIPFIYLLQALSPACDENNPAHMEGATAGTFLFRATNDIVDGDEGFEFQPCRFEKDFVEWVPRKKGGGLVNRTKEMPDDAEKEEDKDNPQKIRYVRPNGNEIIETRYFVGRVLSNNGQGYIIPLTSTGHTFAKGWMTMMNTHILNGKKEDSYARSYLLKSKYMQKGGNSWYTWEVAEDLGFVSDEDYLAGKALHAAFASGEKRANDSQYAEMMSGGGREAAAADNEQEEM